MCLSLPVLYYTPLNGTKLTDAPWRRPMSAERPVLFFFHNTLLNPKREVKKHLDDITHIKFQRSHRSPREGQRIEVGEEKGDGADKNLFVSKWWPALPGQHPGELKWCEVFFNLGKVLRRWRVVRRELLSYSNGEGWGCMFAWWPEAFIRQ